MKPTTPIWYLNKFRNRILDKVKPLRMTEIDGIKFYYTRGNEPQSPERFGHTREMYHKLDEMSGKIFLDVGAHIGSYSLRMARKFQQVIAFEPNPSIRKILRLNIDTNHLLNIRVEEAALSDTSGRGPLFLQRQSGGASSLDPLHYNLRYDRSLQVKVARLDDLPLGNPDLIKIDAEGNELRILKGGRQTIARSKPALCVEVHEAKNTQGHSCGCETCQFLESLNYELEVLGEYRPTHVHWVSAKPLAE